MAYTIDMKSLSQSIVTLLIPYHFLIGPICLNGLSYSIVNKPKFIHWTLTCTCSWTPTAYHTNPLPFFLSIIKL